MICEKHKGMCVLHAFSWGECEICGAEVVTPHIPCYKICPKCSKKQNKCEWCGELIEDEI